MQLRDYQQNMKDRLYDAWTKVSSVMLQMPTGTGKTHLMAAVIRENMEVGVLVVAHRIELIEQISKTLDKFVFSEGFDCPEVEFIQLARPTLSLSKYLCEMPVETGW